MRNISIAFIVIFSIVTSIIKADSNVPQLGKNSIKEVIASMTLEEKTSMLTGNGWNPNQNETVAVGSAGRTFAIPRLGIPSVALADGPAGLRIEAKPKGSERTFYCTAFPTATSLAATWNQELVEQVGNAMGNEVLEYGADVLLAPGMNIHRNPLCGRNFEYFSEDPLLTGKMAAAYVRGIQQNGVGTSLKHFAANNQETNRTSVNEVISQRALREIYLRGFEIAVKESQPWTIMTSYNRLNGFYTAESRELLVDIIRKEWGFDGLVMTDWDGGKDAIAQIRAQNNIIMPGTWQREKLLNAIKNKELDEKVVDENLTKILEFIVKTPQFKKHAISLNPDRVAHAIVARTAATETMVLLKNENQALPFKKVKNIALFGKTSYGFITGGTGSGEVNYEKVISPVEGIINRGFKISSSLQAIYKHIADTIIEGEKKNPKHRLDGSIIIDNLKYVVAFHPEVPIENKDIAKQAASTDMAVITLGRSLGEGWDRNEGDYFNLIPEEIQLIQQVCESYHALGKKVVVVLNVGGVIETASWRHLPDAILLAWQTGQEGGNALADVLSGKVSPSGKLPMSFPLKYSDVPSAKYFPGEPANNPAYSLYNEGIYVGYRYYDSFKVPVSYEFGYGLSYSNFEFSNLQIDKQIFTDKLTIKVTVKNTGKVAAKEVVQLYLSAPKGEIDKPEHELKAYSKTKTLKSDESQVVEFELNPRLLASFWSSIQAWVAQKGIYEVRIGSSSRNIKQKANFNVENDIEVEKVHDVLYPNIVLTEIKGN